MMRPQVADEPKTLGARRIFEAKRCGVPVVGKNDTFEAWSDRRQIEVHAAHGIAPGDPKAMSIDGAAQPLSRPFVNFRSKLQWELGACCRFDDRGGQRMLRIGFEASGKLQHGVAIKAWRNDDFRERRL